ncbi:S-layer homology domain-containing protein [Candidatus Peregrinibacteria bacterium]|nr:S-layer homology domain-containing protein [Candidatus Peregrinibacteria bacterium]
MKTKIAALLSGLTLFVAMLTPSMAVVADFTDTQTHWGKEYVNYVHAECGIDGYKDANGNLLYQFRPDNTITRAELVAMTLKCHGGKDHDGVIINPFSDVQNSDWFYYPAMFAYGFNWIEGYTDGTFKPHQNINRAEALKIIIEAYTDFDSAGWDGDSNYTDVNNNLWAKAYINYASSKNYVSGYSDGTFRPGNNITRAEAAKILSLIHEETTYGNPAPEPQPEQEEPEPTPEEPVNTAGSPTVEGCPVFPSDNPWNTDISSYPVHENSDNYIASILAGRETLHPDFGGNGEYGIPYVTVNGDQPKVPVEAYYGDESDLPAEGYPIPADAPVEGGSDKHVLVIDTDNCMLYETWDSTYVGPGWSVGSAAIFDLMSNALRPDGWTSADAAGLPVFAGLIRYNEAEAGEINHAIRFTASHTQKAYIHPATHFASSSTDPNLPPMGLRLRLKADFDTSGYTGHAKVILEALKKYGMILADNGSDWYITGASDPRWDDDDLGQLKSVPGSAFEVVYTGELHT